MLAKSIAKSIGSVSIDWSVKKKLHVVYLKALGLSLQDIVRIARVSGDSVTRYLKAYVEGGVLALCTSQYYCPVIYNRYYETFHQFKAAIDDCLDKVKSTFSEQIKTLLNPKFQLFEKNPQT